MKRFFALVLFLTGIGHIATSQEINTGIYHKVPVKIAGLKAISHNYLVAKNSNHLQGVVKPGFYSFELFKQHLEKYPWLKEDTNDSLMYGISRHLYTEDNLTLVQHFFCYDYYSTLYAGCFENSGFDSYFMFLPAVLSAYNYRMNSDKGAGLWRLNYFIARRYHLAINDSIDERYNTEKSTVAAIKYLSHLKKQYKNLTLTLYAFVSSAAEINNLINKNGNKTLLSDIPDDIKLDVHLFKSLVFLYYFREDLQLKKNLSEPLLAVSAVALKRKIHFKPLTELMKIDSAYFVFLNPVYKNFFSTDTGTIIIPDTLVPLFTKYENDICIMSDSLFKKDCTFVDKKNVTDNSGSIIHVVRSGETLSQIAAKYKGVTVKSIVKVNKLSSPDKIREGQKLIIKK